VIGAAINGSIIFKKEGIFDHARWNLTVHVMIFDENGEMIADSFDGKMLYDTDIDIHKERHDFMPVDQVPHCTQVFNFYMDGLDAYPNYEGDWTIEVETWIMYWGEASEFLRDAWYGWGTYRTGVPTAILSGYGYRVVAGEIRGDYDFNHLGPYSQGMEVVVPNLQLGGEASPVFELDLMGLLVGQVAGYTWSTDMRTISWADVMVSGASGDFVGYTLDGEYEMFVPPADDYSMTIEEYGGDAGHMAASTSVSVPDGGAVTQNFLNLEQSGIAIPEFPIALLPTLAALGSSILLLRRKR